MIRVAKDMPLTGEETISLNSLDNSKPSKLHPNDVASLFGAPRGLAVHRSQLAFVLRKLAYLR
jgi:hypothetical protein